MANIQEVQLYGLDILKEVAKLCEAHHIPYYLAWGTLLGAIRHNGYIPWDDDIDIEIPVEDYRRFLKYAQKELPHGYFLQTYYSDPGYNEMWAKVRVDGTTSLPVAWKGLKLHFGIGIDIFPLTGVANTPKAQERQVKLLNFARLLLAKDYIVATGTEDIGKSKALSLIYSLPRWLRIGLVRCIQPLIFKPAASCPTAASVSTKIDTPIDFSCYQGRQLHKFEDTELYIPDGFDQILTAHYGDYMTPPPVSEQKCHELLLGDIIFDCHRDFREYQK